MSETGWIIPNDWNGVDWSCFQIQFPDSPQYSQLLRGLLYTLTRGREYDASTGEVRAAQGVGWQVFDRNLALPPCSTSEGTAAPVEQEQQQCGSQSRAFGQGSPSGEESECDDVSGITRLEIVDGVLYAYYGECCRVSIGDIGNVRVGDVLDLPDVDTEGEPLTYYACARAAAVVDAIYAVADGIWQAMETVTLINVWKAPSMVESFADLGDLKDKYIMEGIVAGDAYLGIALADITGYLPSSHDDIFDSDTADKIKCALAKLFGAHGGTMTASERSAIDSVFKQYMALEVTFFESAWRAIGDNKLSQIAQAAATDDTVECPCPESGTVVEIPVDYDWIHIWDFTRDAGTWEPLSSAAWVEGYGIGKAAVQRYDSAMKCRIEVLADTLINYIHVWTTWPTASPYGGGVDAGYIKVNGVGDYIQGSGIPLSSWGYASAVGVAISASQYVELVHWQFTEDDVDGDPGFVTKVIIAGRGADPFTND